MTDRIKITTKDSKAYKEKIAQENQSRQNTLDKEHLYSNKKVKEYLAENSTLYTPKDDLTDVFSMLGLAKTIENYNSQITAGYITEQQKQELINKQSKVKKPLMPSTMRTWALGKKVLIKQQVQNLHLNT